MEYIIAGICIVSFFLCVVAYRKGVKDGISVKNGTSPDKIIPSIKERKMEKESEAEINQMQKWVKDIKDYDPMNYKVGD